MVERHAAPHAPHAPHAPDDGIDRATQDLARVLHTLAEGRRHEGRETMSLARLAKRSGLPMSALLRYLSVLSGVGWVAVGVAAENAARNTENTEESAPEDGRGQRLARLTDAGRAQHDRLMQGIATTLT